MSEASTPGDLIARARRGERAAYNQLFALATDRLLLFTRLRLGPHLRERLDPMDVLQEAYLHAHRDFDRFAGDDDRQFVRWACRIVENRLRDLADHHGAARRRPRGDQQALSDILRQLAESGRSPATSLVRQERRERVTAAVDALPAEEREVLLLRHFEDRTIDDIASRTGRSASSVRRLLGRATTALGRRLRGAVEDQR